MPDSPNGSAIDRHRSERPHEVTCDSGGEPRRLRPTRAWKLAATAIIVSGALSAALPLRASEACRPCHPQQVSGFLRTGMGRSIALPSSAHPSGVYFHGHSGTTFRVDQTDRGTVHRIQRGGFEATYLIDYVIGSGNAALGYLIRVGDAIFQSPIAHYTELGTWGMAPGMERYADPDFARPATADCLWCHADRPRHVVGSVNRYEDSALGLEAISCGRCHGDPEEHLASPEASTVFNPARAAPRERDSVCEQCHLSGLVRVLNPGETFGSFVPGRRLEEYWSVFVGGFEGGDDQRRFQVVSHVEQLALSRCSQQSGPDLWCGTCHDAHSVPQHPAVEVSQRCLSCHAGKLTDDHEALASDCVSCHMPKRRAHDSGHSAFTDHRISRRPIPDPNPVEPGFLVPWQQTEGPLGLRNLGIAKIRLSQRGMAASDIGESVAQLERAALTDESDASLLEALGTGLIVSGKLEEGLRVLERAVQIAPDNVLYRNALGAAWWERRALRKSTGEFKRAMQQEPFLESSYHMLARVFHAAGDGERARGAWKRLLAYRPRLIYPRQQLSLPVEE